MATFKIRLYKSGSGWFFDDPTKGIVKEAFIAGVPDMIKEVFASRIKGRKTITFSDEMFSPSVSITRGKRGNGGVWYTLDNGEEKIKGWFCPVFWKYFKTAPAELFIGLGVED